MGRYSIDELKSWLLEDIAREDVIVIRTAIDYLLDEYHQASYDTGESDGLGIKEENEYEDEKEWI